MKYCPIVEYFWSGKALTPEQPWDLFSPTTAPLSGADPVPSRRGLKIHLDDEYPSEPCEPDFEGDYAEPSPCEKKSNEKTEPLNKLKSALGALGEKKLDGQNQHLISKPQHT